MRNRAFSMALRRRLQELDCPCGGHYVNREFMLVPPDLFCNRCGQPKPGPAIGSEKWKLNQAIQFFQRP